MIFLLLIILAFLLLRIQDGLSQPIVIDSMTTSCSSCDKEIELDWMVCPHCLHRLRESCTACQQGKLISHSFCPSCGDATAR